MVTTVLSKLHAIQRTATTGDQPGDERLVARCRDGDVEAFGLLYERFERPVFRYALYLLGHPEDAADVKQETFLRAYHSLHAFRGDSAVLTWLLRICVNLCRDRRRSPSARDRSLDLSQVERLMRTGDEHDPHVLAERAETIGMILRALQGLPEGLREIVILHEIDGRGIGEVARILGCTAAAARMRLFRARHCLKDRVRSLMGEVRG
jgi:RNA polymerase sigma-70 factor, ECF subfamily